MLGRRALVHVPRIVEDDAWERAMLGPFVDRARRALMRQLRTGRASIAVAPTLARAHQSVPHYQRLFASLALGARDLEDPRALSMIPITRRRDLAAGVAPFLSHPIDRDLLRLGWLGRTSGSTGVPITYLRDPRTIAWFHAFLDFAIAYARVAPFPTGGRVVLLDSIAHRPEYDVKLPLFHDGTSHKRSTTRDDLAEELTRLSPHVVTGDPESLAPLAELDVRVPFVLSSAFAMPRALKQAIAARTGATVLEYYAAQETSVIGIGCREGDGFHPVSTGCLVESAPTPDGPELVVTPTNNPSFVLIRYAPGDLAEIVDERCACGLVGPKIVRLVGRTQVRFDAREGTFAAALVGPLLSLLPLIEHQLVQLSFDRYLLRYVPKAGAAIAEADLDAVRTRLRELAGAMVSIELEAHASPLPRRGSKPEPYVRTTP